jgi:glutamate dehydrogenase
MTSTSHLPSFATEPFLQPILSLISSDDSVINKPLLAQFIPLFYRSLTKDYVVTKSDALHWYALAKSQWFFMQKRASHEIKLRVFNPDLDKDSVQAGYTLVELDMQDMPFLVDSMRMCLQALHIPIIHMIYVGGLYVVRDAQGSMRQVHGYSGKVKTNKDEQEYFEAPIQIQIERQTDPKKLVEIQDRLAAVVDDVKMVTQDWQAMTHHVEELIEILREPIDGVSTADERESRAFLQWLLKDHFTFLGLREYRLIKTSQKEGLELIPESGLGVLRDTSHASAFRSFETLSQAARSLATSLEPCIELGKTNTKATVHRPVYTDYIGVKLYKEGKVVGFYRIIGLYTSLAYRDLPENVPFVRRKMKAILQRSGFAPNSHPGKDLLHILHTFPRDDLFHASEEELYTIALGIMLLQERRCIRLFPRVDRFGRFISCLVFVPRENFTTELAEKMRSIIGHALKAKEVLLDTYFSSSVLVRIHCVVRLDEPFNHAFDFSALEQALVDLGLLWGDHLLKVLCQSWHIDEAHRVYKTFESAFSAAYKERFTALEASEDIKQLRALDGHHTLGVHFYDGANHDEGEVRLKLYRDTRPLTLSEIVPLLEHMGFTVFSEDLYRISLSSEQEYWISDFSLSCPVLENGMDIDLINELCSLAIVQIWSGALDSDGFNQLMMKAGLTFKNVLMLRAYSKYLRQLSFVFSQQAIERALYENPSVTQVLVEFFIARFDPVLVGDRSAICAAIEEKMFVNLDRVKSLDHDRIFRLYMHMIQATLRTNYFFSSQTVRPLALKFNPAQIPDVPKPVPAYDIFVYSARFEGVHLRSKKVARGGFRWSDRFDDYRTEILGLMKAQHVKNSVIVPAGAKGGFVTKRVHPFMPKDEVMAEGIACYQTFIQNLLDMVDNLSSEGAVIHKPMVRYDEDDCYLVVAADKGTATFSDFANAVSKENHFWLGDAFASGGSQGYDHKKMGITARGAWISAQRHFMEMGKNVDKDRITVTGIGDMSGDVFGNGLLMSARMQLVAAFNHMHIFIDPNPDPEKSFQERRRLFQLPRSTWDDYNKEIISQGGGVYRRDAKSITLSIEAQQRLGLTCTAIAPDALIRAVLLADVDMLWNGGIGTYIKSAQETNEQVGDRHNDLIRVDGHELRTKVVCEGGNLGATQLGRIAYALKGGRINTDFIDNSGGVDCSDHEVNIKILLNRLVQASKLTQEGRDQLLVQMEPDVARLVLMNNYRQNQTLSMMASKALTHLEMYIAFMKSLEDEGVLDRKLVGLPTTKKLLARKAHHKSLTRPEMALLLSTAKNVLKDKILNGVLVSDPTLQDFIFEAFPLVLKERYLKEVLNHPLHNEILVTQLSHTLISDMGILFVFQMMNETDASLVAIVKAYVAARSIFETSQLYLDVANLDYRVAPVIQLDILEAGMCLIKEAVRWFLAQPNLEHCPIAQMIELYKAPVMTLFSKVQTLLMDKDLKTFQERQQLFQDAGVPKELAERVVGFGVLSCALNIVEASKKSSVAVADVAKAYFHVVEHLHCQALRMAIDHYPSENRWNVLAKASFHADLSCIERVIVIDILTHASLLGDESARMAQWSEMHKPILGRYQELLHQLMDEQASDFSMIAVAIRLLHTVAHSL